MIISLKWKIFKRYIPHHSTPERLENLAACSYDTLLIKYLLLLLQTPMKCLLPSFEAIVKCLLLF